MSLVFVVLEKNINVVVGLYSKINNNVVKIKIKLIEKNMTFYNTFDELPRRKGYGIVFHKDIDINIQKFTRVLKSFCEQTQFIIVTHNKLTMEIADYLYGVTQEIKGISKLVSVKFK